MSTGREDTASRIAELEAAIKEKDGLIDKLQEEFDILSQPEPDLEKPQLEVEMSRGFEAYIPGAGLILLGVYNLTKDVNKLFWLGVGLTLAGVISLARVFLMKVKPKLKGQIHRENLVKIEEYNAKVLARNARIEEKELRQKEIEAEAGKLEEEIAELRKTLEELQKSSSEPQEQPA